MIHALMKDKFTQIMGRLVCVPFWEGTLIQKPKENVTSNQTAVGFYRKLLSIQPLASIACSLIIPKKRPSTLLGLFHFPLKYRRRDASAKGTAYPTSGRSGMWRDSRGLPRCDPCRSHNFGQGYKVLMSGLAPIEFLAIHMD